MTADAKTPTPRTDAEFERNGVGKLCVFTDFARQLERDLTALRERLAGAEKDAERYRARRAKEYSDYDEYCDSVMPRDGSATRVYEAEFVKNHDTESDYIVQDYTDAAIGREGGK
jgi:hypothetical protein